MGAPPLKSTQPVANHTAIKIKTELKFGDTPPAMISVMMRHNCGGADASEVVVYASDKSFMSKGGEVVVVDDEDDPFLDQDFPDEFKKISDKVVSEQPHAMAETVKTTLQKHGNSINGLESKLDQVHLVMIEEAHKNAENLEGVKNQMAYLTSTTEQNNKRFDDLMETMEFFKRNWKGKYGENMEAGSSSKTRKQVGAKNTRYPPGFRL
ncbi:hypothetical protein AgCh_038277 [Apium graveolens]